MCELLGPVMRGPMISNTEKSSILVFVRTKAGFQATAVQLGDSAGDSVIIKSGLKGTEEIATVNSFTLKAELGKSEAAED